ncbi:NAD(P)H-binding protein [Streptomyces cacaoi]
MAAVRHPGGAADLAARGVEVRLGDYDAPATLRTAFEGAGRLLLISSPELDSARRAGQHRAAVDAAREVGVGSVVYTSFLEADTQADGVTAAHHATERTLAASGLPHTLLRHPYYNEAFLDPGLRDAVASGEPADGTGGRGINTALRSDLAEAAARVLTEDGHLGRVYTTSPAVCGPTAGSPARSAVSAAGPSSAGTGAAARPVPRAGWRSRSVPAPWSGRPAICGTSSAARPPPSTRPSPQPSPRPPRRPPVLLSRGDVPGRRCRAQRLQRSRKSFASG